jgi:GAF domain-containing protein
MAPAHGITQSFANRLFIGTRGLDFRMTMNKATAILRSVTTLPDLLQRFAKTIGDAVGTDRVLILLASRTAFAQAHPPRTATDTITDLSKADSIVRYLEGQPEPLVLDELHRIRATPDLEQVMAQMHELKVAAAMPIFARDHLEGIMLLGPRLSGRIYGSVEQNALQVLCGQLAVAVENAQLFTEVQNAKIYNETLLQNLTTGVIAADADGRITVFNKEAEQITDLQWKEVLEHSIEDLPPPLSAAMRQHVTLRRRSRSIARSSCAPAIRRSSCARAVRSFHSQDGHMLGALMVLTGYHRAEAARTTDSPQRSPRESRDALRRHGARNQEPARLDQDVHAAPAGAVSGLRFPRDVLEFNRATRSIASTRS